MAERWEQALLPAAVTPSRRQTKTGESLSRDSNSFWTNAGEMSGFFTVLFLRLNCVVNEISALIAQPLGHPLWCTSSCCRRPRDTFNNCLTGQFHLPLYPFALSAQGQEKPLGTAAVIFCRGPLALRLPGHAVGTCSVAATQPGMAHRLIASLSTEEAVYIFLPLCKY